MFIQLHQITLIPLLLGVRLSRRANSNLLNMTLIIPIRAEELGLIFRIFNFIFCMWGFVLVCFFVCGFFWWSIHPRSTHKNAIFRLWLWWNVKYVLWIQHHSTSHFTEVRNSPGARNCCGNLKFFLCVVCKQWSWVFLPLLLTRSVPQALFSRTKWRFFLPFQLPLFAPTFPNCTAQLLGWFLSWNLWGGPAYTHLMVWISLVLLMGFLWTG